MIRLQYKAKKVNVPVKTTIRGIRRWAQIQKHSVRMCNKMCVYHKISSLQFFRSRWQLECTSMSQNSFYRRKQLWKPGRCNRIYRWSRQHFVECHLAQNLCFSNGWYKSGLRIIVDCYVHNIFWTEPRNRWVS